MRQIDLESLRQLFLLFVTVANVRRQITLRQVGATAVRNPTDENSAARALSTPVNTNIQALYFVI